jgi:hypothetical protein
LVPALVREDRLERKIKRVRVALEGVRIDNQQILVRRACQAIQGAACLAVDMSVLDTPDES